MINEQYPSLREVCAPYFKTGAAITPRQVADEATAQMISRNFSSITCENVMKPELVLDREATLQSGSETHPCITMERGAPIADFCVKHGLTLRFHVLVWHGQTPRWFFTRGWSDAPDAELVEPDILLQRMDAYIHDVMQAMNTRWPGLVSCWDVVNEAIEPDHGHELLLRTKNSLYYQILGSRFILEAFRMARKYAAPGQKLFYNDFNSFQPAKQLAIIRQLQPLLAEKLLDGMGMQSHIHMAFPDLAEYENALRVYAALGVTIQVTELDIRNTDGTKEGEKALAERYRALTEIYRRACEDGIDIESVTWWGVTDRSSWLNKPDQRNYPLLFGDDLQPKPAFFAVCDVLK